MIPLKCMTVLVVLGTLAAAVVPQEDTTCTWLTVSGSGCVKDAICEYHGDGIYIWEDCLVGEELFTITDSKVTLDECEYVSGNPKVTLAKTLDAENPLPATCQPEGHDNLLIFVPLDIDELPPYPAQDTVPITEVKVNENTIYKNAKQIHYSDDDVDETVGLTCIELSPDPDNIFSLTPVDDGDKNIKTFTFAVNEKLDFENQVFYKMEYNITSKDEKEKEMSTKQTFFVYVQDEPDNPPMWIRRKPVYNLSECQTEADLFNVTAQDRDVDMNYKIKYSLLEDSEYFKINTNTGQVTRTAEVDRDELELQGISTFSLDIIATEYKDEDTIGEEPNQNDQVTIITIVDCNDECPIFDKEIYHIEMDELTQDSKDQVVIDNITVRDMDEGDKGVFLLTTNNSKVLGITPKGNKISSDITLTALWVGEANNYFNYEIQLDTPLEFTITATEVADQSHFTNASVIIVLRDLNDNVPEFIDSPYTSYVKETKSKGSDVATVKAMDDDVNPAFGQPSVRYSLESFCNQLRIDDTTGTVTLAVKQDYDDTNTENEFTCQVFARDTDGEGLQGASEITISVIDVVDEPPYFKISNDKMTIKENSKAGDAVGTFIVIDADQYAHIDFTRESSICSSDPSKNVDSWFDVMAGSPDHPQYPATVKVKADNIDREVCREVTLSIKADDRNTEADESSDDGTIVITIQDEKDSAPVFIGDYSNLSTDEISALKPVTGDTVFVVTVSDRDEEDTIKLSISKGADQMELSEDKVTVQDGEEKLVEIRKKNGAVIDRELYDRLEIEITLSNDAKQDVTHQSFIIMLNDLNDNQPVITEETCVVAEGIHVSEDMENGTYIGYTVIARDDDVESPFNVVNYFLTNDWSTNPEDLLTPFTVDENTGEVHVLRIKDEKILDREQYSEWDLTFEVIDQCRKPATLDCSVLRSDMCTVKIIVDDVNDNYPEDLTWTPDGKITVTDFLKKDQEIGYQIWAVDKDEGENAELNYTIESTVPVHGGDELELFYPETYQVPGLSYCNLFGAQDFIGKNFTGTYNVTLKAMDGGEKSTLFVFQVTVEDGNDQTPVFVFDGCPGEPLKNTIKMAEKEYQPGVDGKPASMEVKCSNPDGPEFIITVRDDDIDPENKKVNVEIDMANSTVENAAPEDEAELLSYWSLEPDFYLNGYRLMLSHSINRDKGTAYNLSLHVHNVAPPFLESWAWVRVVIMNVKEDDPYFCEDGNCPWTVYTYENNATAEIYIPEAVDLDNAFLDPDDDEYDLVYYFIVGGDSKYFKTTSDTERRIILDSHELPDGLDREDKSSYSLDIFATNDPNGGNIDITDPSRRDVLHLSILVGDKNDETPIFDDVILTSFMESNKNEDDLIVIEAVDLDLNETLSYSLLDEPHWFDTAITPTQPFALAPKDSRSVYLKLNFDPKGMERGYCIFNISVEDKVAHKDQTEVKVYIISADYQVAMYFSNTVEDIKNKQADVEYAFTQAYNYSCTIDSITATQTDTGDVLSNKTTVYMHFINNDENEPVKDKIILDLSDNANVMRNLQQRLDLIDVKLDSVNSYTPPTSDTSLEETILTLKILLSVVALVLGSFLLLLTSIYCIRTRSLKRKVKVLSTNTFGSKESGLNHIGMDAVTVPGSNLANVLGNQNPVFNENETVNYKNQQSGSISSGGSDLIGVEDNPEFKSYSAGEGPRTTSSRGFESPSYGHTIDEVSAVPLGVQGGVKGNPLLNLGDLQGESVSSNSSLKPRASVMSGGSDGSTESVTKKMNSNFSFL